MNDRQIKAFVEAARLLNFTKAAEKLYVPQSQVSRAIKGLEDELGVILFDRKTLEVLSYHSLVRNTIVFLRDSMLNLPKRESHLGTRRMS